MVLIPGEVEVACAFPVPRRKSERQGSWVPWGRVSWGRLGGFPYVGGSSVIGWAHPSSLSPRGSGEIRITVLTLVPVEASGTVASWETELSTPADWNEGPAPGAEVEDGVMMCIQSAQKGVWKRVLQYGVQGRPWESLPGSGTGPAAVPHAGGRYGNGGHGSCFSSQARRDSHAACHRVNRRALRKLPVGGDFRWDAITVGEPTSWGRERHEDMYRRGRDRRWAPGGRPGPLGGEGLHPYAPDGGSSPPVSPRDRGPDASERDPVVVFHRHGGEWDGRPLECLDPDG